MGVGQGRSGAQVAGCGLRTRQGHGGRPCTFGGVAHALFDRVPHVGLLQRDVAANQLGLDDLDGLDARQLAVTRPTAPPPHRPAAPPPRQSVGV